MSFDSFEKTRYLMEQLRQIEAILPGHYRLKGEDSMGKRHGEGYIDKGRILMHARLSADFAEAIANYFCKQKVDVVVGPETSGARFARDVAHALMGRSMLGIRVLPVREISHGMFRIGEEDAHEVFKKRVLVIEDIITTGHTTMSAIEAVNACGGDVIGVGAMCNRESLSESAFPIPEHSFYAVLNLQMRSWPAHDCDMCKHGFDIDTPASKRVAMGSIAARFAAL